MQGRVHRCRGVVVLAVASLLAACTGGTTAPSPSPSPTPSSGAPSPTASEEPASPTPSAAEVFALHRYAAQMPSGWREPIVLPYGDGPEQLGTTLGGDGEGIQWGPAYGAIAADGTWWILDAAKRRFAHYDAAGAYLDDVAIPTALQQQGQFVQWQDPRALADGTIVTYQLSPGSGTRLLLLRAGRLQAVTLDREFLPKADDGVLLYGVGADGELLAADLTTDAVTPVTAFRSRAGASYVLRRDGSALLLDLPEQGVTQRWPIVADDTGSPAAGAISLVTTADGRLHVLVDGAADDEPGVGRSGFASVDATGTLSPTEATRDPWSPSDPGTGSRIVGRPGGDDVWMIAIDEDAVRLYARS